MEHTSTILIIDDDPYGRDALGMVLGMYDYKLVFAANGLQGLEKAAAVAPDLILLDVMMPGMDGYEVCTRIRSDAMLAEIPVVMITALNDRESRLRGINAGADDFITKPIDTMELMARVRGITRLNRYRRILDQRYRFEWVVEQSNNGYLLVNDEDHIVYANPTARRYLGQVAGIDDIEGLPFLAVAGYRYRGEPESAWQTWASRPFHSETPLYLIAPESPTSPAVWLHVTTLDQAHSPQGRRLIRLEDVTRHMDTQRATWTFQSMVGHKLNTPLHIILNSLDLLNLQPVEELHQDELREMLSWVTEGLGHLRKSVTGVLCFVTTSDQVRRGAVCEWDQLSQMVEHIRATLRLDTIKVRLPGDVSQPIRLAESALEVVLLELLKNAKKFHPRHEPRVEITVVPTATNRVRIEVMDDGVTLSATQLDHIWTPYYQSERTFTGEVPGMGLGLAMVRNIIWQAGGTCQARNRRDGPGLAIEIELPMCAAAVPGQAVCQTVIA